MITGNSPGIYIKENNLAESPRTQIYHRGAIVGQFASGPINQRFLTDSKGLSVFGDIDLISSSSYCNCPIPEIFEDKLEVKDQNVYDILLQALKYDKQL